MNFIITRKGETVHTSKAVETKVPQEGKTEVEFNETFELPTADDYVFVLLDAEGNSVGSKEGLVFTADDAALSLVSHTINPDPIQFEKPVELSFEVQNDGFRFDGPLHFIILSDKSETALFTSEEQGVEAARGEKVTVSYNATTGLDDYDNYTIRLLMPDGTLVGEVTGVKSIGKSGILSVSSDENLAISNGFAIYAGASAIEIFEISGSLVARSGSDRIDISGLASGVYLLRATSGENRITCKIII